MELPRTIGRYEVDEVVGQGGMGRVLRARDSVLGRTVAIKVIRDDLGLPPEVKDAVIARMRQEARAAAAVSHPNMVTLHDMGEEEAVGLYLVFEFVEGPTLRQAIDDASPDAMTPSLRIKLGERAALEEPARGALEPREVVRIAREIASALDRAHAAGVIHRDVKPENVLLADLGAKITDFGIARMPDSTLTLQSTVMGTPAYSAPEALSQAAFSPRSDQFSLACVLYEALTGVRAFPGDDGLAVAAKVATEDPPPVRSVGGLLDRASQVLLRGLAKDPARRYGSCTELAQALDDALTPVIERTPLPVTTQELPKPPESAVLVVGTPGSGRRRPALAILGVMVVLGLGALFFGLGGARRDSVAATAPSASTGGPASAAATTSVTLATPSAPSSSASAPTARRPRPPRALASGHEAHEAPSPSVVIAAPRALGVSDVDASAADPAPAPAASADRM